MMYKRQLSKNAFQYKEPKAKMRKLNVSLSDGNAGTSNQTDNAQSTASLQLSKPSTSKVVNNDNANDISPSVQLNKQPDVVVPPLPPSNDDNLWGDADDECILIASQMVDNMDMDAINQQIIVQSMNLSQNNVVETKVKSDILKDFFHSSEDDDRIFSEINNFDDVGVQYVNEGTSSTVIHREPQQASQRPKSPSVFKIPAQIRHEKRTSATVAIQSSGGIDMNISFQPVGRPQSTQFSQKGIEIPKALEPTESSQEGENLKVKFLTQKKCDLQKEIEHLECENQRLTELCQTKDGESSLLRSENERLKNLCDSARRDKSAEITNIRNDHSLKVSELEKLVLDLRSQLQFKEISSMQQTRKVSCSDLSQSVMNQTTETYQYSWEKFRLPHKSCLPVQGAKPVDPRIYISSKLSDSNWVSINDKKQWEYLNGLQLILADLMASKDFNNSGIPKMLEQIFSFASLSVAEIFASSMKTQIDLKKKEFSYSDICEWKEEYSIVSENKLFNREEAYLSRRILVCLAKICEQFSQFSSMLIVRNCTDDQAESFLELLSLSIRNFSCYKNVANVQGFIEGSTLLLSTIAENYDITISKSTTVIASLLHNILLCQPGIGSLEKISKFLEIISYRSKDNDLLDSLCQNKNTYDIIEPQGFIKYGSDSCTLQIYAAFIRLYILPNKERKLSIKQLTEIIQSTFLFMRNSFLKLPKWLATEKRGSCLCRVRLFGAVVTLFYVYLLYWIEHPQEIDAQTILTVSKFGVEFLYENLLKNYEQELLNAGGSIIKNRIRMIVEWLNFYDFKFKSAHKHALHSVYLQRLGPMVEHLRYNKNIISKFSAEASEIYKEVVDSFFDECK